MRAQATGKRHALGLLGGMFCSAWAVGCSPECSQGFVGSSSGAPQIVESQSFGTGGYGSGNAAGVWSLTLVPTSFGTSCVTLGATSSLSEVYAYTLEFKGAEAVQLYLEGVPFAEGQYVDYPAGGAESDLIQWKTPTRTESDRPEGTVDYVIEGEGHLSANPQAAVLSWTGWERITVVSSEDPDVRPGCTYSYDVSGYKVCDE